MHLSVLDNALWAAGFIGHAALLLILLLRRRNRDFPIFTAFVGYDAVTTVLLFLVSRFGSRHAYFLAYWITGFADYFFQVAVVFEVTRDVLRPTGTWVRDARIAFFCWGVVGFILSLVVALFVGPPQARGFDLWDVRITVFTSLLICALFVSITAAANLLGLQQRSYSFSLGGGFFVWAFSSLLEEFGHVVFGWDRKFIALVYARQLVYLLVLLYWMVVFWLPEKVQAALSPEMAAYLLVLHDRVRRDLEKTGRFKR